MITKRTTVFSSWENELLELFCDGLLINAWLINVCMGGRDFLLRLAYIIICWAVCGRVGHFHTSKTFLEVTMPYSASYETQINPITFNCFFFRWSKLKSSMKGSVVKTKVDWIREYDFDSVTGHGFKKNFHKNVSVYEKSKFLLSTKSQGCFEFQTLPSPHFSQVIQNCLNFWVLQIS